MGNNFAGAQPLPLRDSLTLHAWEKWKKYRRFPWKLTVDVATLTLAIVFTLLVAAQTSLYANASSDTFEHLFGVGGSGTARLYNDQDFMNQALMISQNYWTLNNVSLSKLWHMRDPQTNAVVGPELTLVSFVDGLGHWNATLGEYIDPKSFALKEEKFILAQDDELGPLTVNSTAHSNLSLLQNLRQARISFFLVSLNVGILGSFAYKWEVRALFDFAVGGGLTEFRLESSKRMQPSSVGSISSLQLGISLVLLFLSGFSIFLAVRALIRSYSNCQRIRGKVAQLPLHYGRRGELTLRMQFNFFELWNVWNLFGDLLLVTSCILSLFHQYIGDAMHFDIVFNFLLGLGTFISCVNILRYFEFSRHLNVLVDTLRLSFGRVIPFVLSFIPIYFGLVMLAISLFSQYTTRFSTVDLASVSLFALILGDDVHATFDEMTEEYPYLWVSRIFLYVYCILAIAAVLNVCIFLIEDAYHAAKLVDRKSTLDRRKSVAVIEGKGGSSHHDMDVANERTLADLIAILERHEGGKTINDISSGPFFAVLGGRQDVAEGEMRNLSEDEEAPLLVRTVEDESNHDGSSESEGKQQPQIPLSSPTESKDKDEVDVLEQRLARIEAAMIANINREFALLRTELRSKNI